MYLTNWLNRDVSRKQRHACQRMHAVRWRQTAAVGGNPQSLASQLGWGKAGSAAMSALIVATRLGSCLVWLPAAAA